MPVQADHTQLLLGRGKVFFDSFDSSGASTGLRFLGEADKLEINPSVQTKEYYTHTKATATKLAQNITQQTHEFDLQLREFQSENVALALLGDSVIFTQAQTTIAANAPEQLSAKATPGRVYQTANRNISAVTATSGSTPLVSSTDYEILDSQMGLIRVLPGTTVLDGTKPMSVAYTASSVTTTQVQAGTSSKIEGKLVYISDAANGPNFDAEIWRVRVQPSSALALITDDYGSIPLKCEAMDDSANHPAQPLYRLTKRS